MNHKGQALKKAIEQTKTKKSDLIKKLGISVPTFYSWLNKKDLSDDKINRVTTALGGAGSKTGTGSKKKPGRAEKAGEGTGGVHKGQSLRKTIEQAKAKKSDLIRRLGISAPTFYFWLNKKDLSDEKISRVTKALGSGRVGRPRGPVKKSAKVVKSGAGQVRSSSHKGQALKKAIEQTKTKKSDLIRRLGISVPTFYSWLNKKDLSDEKINRVKKALGSGPAQRAIPASRKQSGVAAAGAGSNGVVGQISDLQRIIINLQQHLIDSLRGSSLSFSSAPVEKTRRRRRRKSSK